MSDDTVPRRKFLALGGLTGATLLTGYAAATKGSSDDRQQRGHHERHGAKHETDRSRPSNGIEFSFLGRYETGQFDEGAAEIVTYDPDLQRAFFVSAEAGTVDSIDLSDPSHPEKVGSVDLSDAWGGAGDATSVDVYDGLVAATVAADDETKPGRVVFYDGETLDVRSTVAVGSLPDMVTFTPDGETVLVANEGEPNDDYDVDPRGSVSIVPAYSSRNCQVETADFTAYDGTEDELRADGVRIFGPDASASQDFEPEYITVSDDSKTAWVSLQENNALAVVDIESATVTDILPLGYKDHMLPGNELDASNEDDGINMRNWPVYGMYQPDGIASYEVEEESYIVTANEGDSRDYDGFSEEVSVEDLELDPEAFDFDRIDGIDSVEQLQDEENLGSLHVTNQLGDIDGDGKFEEIYAFGGRSFSIWNEEGRLMYDSGSEFARIIARQYPDHFNTNNDENEPDGRSDNKGPEPEGVDVGVVGGRTYAFIGLERMGGIMVYDISNPQDAEFVQYLNDRDFSVQVGEDIDDGNLPAGAAGDLGPEGVKFVSATESPIDAPLVLTGNEISGTMAVHRIDSLYTSERNSFFRTVTRLGVRKTGR